MLPITWCSTVCRPAAVDCRWLHENWSSAALAIEGGTVSAWLTPEGELNLPGLLGEARAAAGRPADDGPAPAAATAPPPQGEQQDWEVRLPAIAARNLDVTLEDRSVQPVVSLHLAPLGFRVNDYSSRPGTVVKLDVDSVVNGKGTLRAAAVVALDTLSAQADIELSDFDLACCSLTSRKSRA
jgi:hypothetical protein